MNTIKTPEQIANKWAYTVDAYQDSAEEVGHPDGQPVIETFPQLAGIIWAAIKEDRAQRDQQLQADLRLIRDESGDWRGLLDSLIDNEDGEEA